MLIFAIALLLLVLYYTVGPPHLHRRPWPLTWQADARRARSQDFYGKTVNKMDERDAEAAELGRKMAEKQREAANVVKAKADAPAAGGDQHVLKDDGGVESAETQQEHDVEVELNSILKRSPSASLSPRRSTS